MAIHDRTETTRPAGASAKRGDGLRDPFDESEDPEQALDGAGTAQDALLEEQVQASREAAEMQRRAVSGPRSLLGPSRDPDATEEPDSRVEDDDDDLFPDDGPTITPRKVDLAGNPPDRSRDGVEDDDDDDDDVEDFVGSPAVPPRVPPRPSKPKPVFGA